MMYNSNETEIMPSKKEVYFEILRLICIFLVMFNHTAPTGYLAYVGENNAIKYFLYLFFSVACKMAVPVFFMISGALLLGKKEPITVLLKKRVIRMLIVLILISIPYYLWLSKDSPKNLMSFFQAIYSEEVIPSLWYLYAYLAFLLMLPFLRAMVFNMKENEYRYLIFLQLIFSVLYCVVDNFISTGHNSSFNLGIVLETNLFYPMIGYYIDKVVDKKCFNKRNYLILTMASIVSIAVTCVVSILFYGVYSSTFDNHIYETFFNMLIAVPSLSIFFIFKGLIKIDSNSRAGRIICTLGDSVFGLYLVQKICRLVASPIYKWLNPYIGSFSATIIMVISGMILGLIGVTAVKKVPYLGAFISKYI